MGQFHFDPDDYARLMAEEVPAYARLQRAVAGAAGAHAPGGRFVLGDLIVPDDPAEVVTPIDGTFDQPSTIEEQIGWLTDAGLAPALTWRERDLAVLVATRAA